LASLKRVTQKNDDATLKHKTQDCSLWHKELLCSSIVLLYLILTISKIIKNKYVVKRAGNYGFTGLGSTSRTTCAPTFFCTPAKSYSCKVTHNLLLQRTQNKRFSITPTWKTTIANFSIHLLKRILNVQPSLEPTSPRNHPEKAPFFTNFLQYQSPRPVPAGLNRADRVSLTHPGKLCHQTLLA
jgi:hypothetical protein